MKRADSEGQIAMGRRRIQQAIDQVSQLVKPLGNPGDGARGRRNRTNHRQS